MPRNQDHPNVAPAPDVKFTHIGAEFPRELDIDIKWRAETIERTSRIYRAAYRKNEPELALKHKEKQLYDAIKDMFKYVTHLKDKELEDQLRYIQDSEPTLRKKRAKAYGELQGVHNEITRASWDKKYKRPRE